MASQWPYAADGTTAVKKSFTQGLVMAQSCLQSGGIPSTNGTLTITQPATVATINDGSSNFITVYPNSTSLTFTASKDTYVDLDTSGAYHQTAVTNGAGAPSVFANSVRLYKAVSNGSAVTSVVALIPGPFSTANGQSEPAPVSPYAVSAPDETAANVSTYGPNAKLPTDTLQQSFWRLLYKVGTAISNLAQTAIGYDASEAASASGTSSLIDNMNHMRQGFVNLFGDTFAHLLSAPKAAILQDGTNAGAIVTVNRLLKHPTGTPTIGSATGGPSLGEWSISGNDDHGLLLLGATSNHLLPASGGAWTLAITFHTAYSVTPRVAVSIEQGITSGFFGWSVMAQPSTTGIALTVVNNSASNATLTNANSLSIAYTVEG